MTAPSEPPSGPPIRKKSKALVLVYFLFSFPCVIYALSLLSPQISGVLMLLGLGLFAGLSINTGFLVIARETWAHRWPRRWAILPAFWFGGYLVITAMCRIQDEGTKNELIRKNSEVTVKYDASRSVLIKGETENFAKSLVQYHGAVEAIDYKESHGVHGSKEGGQYTPPAIAWRLGSKPVCNLISKYPIGSFESMPLQTATQDGYMTSFKYDDKLCLYSRPVIAPNNTLVISEEKKYKRGLTGQIHIYPIKLSQPSGEKADVSLVTFSPPLWIPLPYVGCFPDNGFSTWKCGFYFMREEPPSRYDAVSGDPGAALVAAVLGWKKSGSLQTRGDSEALGTSLVQSSFRQFGNLRDFNDGQVRTVQQRAEKVRYDERIRTLIAQYDKAGDRGDLHYQCETAFLISEEMERSGDQNGAIYWREKMKSERGRILLLTPPNERAREKLYLPPLG